MTGRPVLERGARRRRQPKLKLSRGSAPAKRLLLPLDKHRRRITSACSAQGAAPVDQEPESELSWGHRWLAELIETEADRVVADDESSRQERISYWQSLLDKAIVAGRPRPAKRYTRWIEDAKRETPPRALIPAPAVTSAWSEIECDVLSVYGGAMDYSAGYRFNFELARPGADNDRQTLVQIQVAGAEIALAVELSEKLGEIQKRLQAGADADTANADTRHLWLV